MDFSVYTLFSPRSWGAWGKLSLYSQAYLQEAGTFPHEFVQECLGHLALPALLDFYPPVKVSHTIVSTVQRKMDFPEWKA